MTVLPEEVSQRVHQRFLIRLSEFQVSFQKSAAVPRQTLNEYGQDLTEQLPGGLLLQGHRLVSRDRACDELERIGGRRQSGIPMDPKPALLPGEQAQGCRQAYQEVGREPQWDASDPVPTPLKPQATEELRYAASISLRVLGDRLNEVWRKWREKVWA
jgi:hypothetical protein